LDFEIYLEFSFWDLEFYKLDSTFIQYQNKTEGVQNENIL